LFSILALQTIDEGGHARSYPQIVSRILVLCFALASCTLGEGPVAMPRQPMPSEMLDHQDPGADTSKNRIISRSEDAPPHPDAAATLAAYALDLVFRK
jgi:hypothetical protein